jgi:hypothetical protein
MTRMLSGRDKVDLGEGFSGSDSQGSSSKLETERKMEMIQFLLEFTAVTVLIAAAAPLTLTSWFTGRKNARKSIDA